MKDFKWREVYPKQYEELKKILDKVYKEAQNNVSYAWSDNDGWSAPSIYLKRDPNTSPIINRVMNDIEALIEESFNDVYYKGFINGMEEPPKLTTEEIKEKVQEGLDSGPAQPWDVQSFISLMKGER